ncbi:MAG TPA: hypothetical protein VJC21_03885 [Candidatus Nanoarchaeia archaeon]|nr:hypothetical protein [Candidatus Nanoarchaeia archaeon]
MPWYEKKWWKRLVGGKAEREKLEPSKDIQALLEFLEGLPRESQRLHAELRALEELESEYAVARKELQQTNLKAQAKVLDTLLERTEFFENDAALAGIRMQRLAEAFLHRAQEAGLKGLVKEKRKKAAWKLRW